MKFIVDNKIPFIKGRLEPLGEVVYADPFAFTPQLVKDADALIIRTRTHCDEALLDGSSVKLVATATIGTDQIDIPWCEANGITVENAAGCNAPGVAQYVWSSLLRNGFDPSRHTLGVVGKGNIGSIVADWGCRLGANVIVCDPPRQKAGHKDEDYLPLEEVLAKADAVTLHTPLTKEGDDSTYHLISEPQ
ncbi:MAG: 4-phosphoerythronate dehydrogenase, partial [Muribaculaceae bacterium]|nr:4-phosphoerythronate dehydrogenase [Muribaculaceae bacterium]